MRALAEVIEEAGIAPAEAERRAEKAVIFLHGSLVVSRALGTNHPFLHMIDEFPDELLRQ